MLSSSLATGAAQRQNSHMRGLVTILLGAALVFGIYHFYFKKMPTTDEGTAPTQAISLIGVREDLLLIAHAENSYIGRLGNTRRGRLMGSYLAFQRLDLGNHGSQQRRKMHRHGFQTYDAVTLSY